MKLDNELAAGVIKRFLQICSEAIQEGHVDTEKEFAESIGLHPQNMSLMKRNGRAPTVEQIIEVCTKFGYSANWIMLNQAPKKQQKEILKGSHVTVEQRILNLETEVARLTRSFDRLKSNSK